MRFKGEKAAVVHWLVELLSGGTSLYGAGRSSSPPPSASFRNLDPIPQQLDAGAVEGSAAVSVFVVADPYKPDEGRHEPADG